MKSISFNCNEIRYKVEDQLNIMLLTTYEIEMHLKAILYLVEFLDENDIDNQLYSQLWKTHDDLVLIKTSYLLKNKKRHDELHSLKLLESFFISIDVGNCHTELQSILKIIEEFYEKYDEISQVLDRRHTAAHLFNVEKAVNETNNNSVDFYKHLEIILEARVILNELYRIIFDREFKNIDVDTDLYLKVYKEGVNVLIENKTY